MENLRMGLKRDAVESLHIYVRCGLGHPVYKYHRTTTRPSDKIKFGQTSY